MPIRAHGAPFEVRRLVLFRRKGCAVDAEEIILLTADSVAALVAAHRSCEETETGKRRMPRWPFPGTTQLWLTDAAGVEKLVFATCCNISADGLGLRTDDSLPVGTTVPIAIHLPQATYHGKAAVRHCTASANGYFVGMEFSFE
ncbi:MAG: PilZ domain-containing protein [Phycisphaerae bacterium]|nr:PilZ domain-containing protein [Phycisphaerae bacterium]